MPTNTAAPPTLTYHIDTGTLHLGDQAVTGIASRDMVDTVAYDVSSVTISLRDRISELENELRELRYRFTADFVKELVNRCEQFVNGQEFTGMTDAEFESEVRSLLFGRGA